MPQPELRVLGSGSFSSAAYSIDHNTPRRALSGYLLNVDQSTMLLEASGGISDRLLDVGVDPSGLDAILVSHHHPDHFVMAPLIAQIGAIQKERRKNAPDIQIPPKKLLIAGPPQTEKRFHAQWASSYESDADYKASVGNDLELIWHEYADGEEFMLPSGIPVLPSKVLHGTTDAYALKFTFPQGTFAYSGDMGLGNTLSYQPPVALEGVEELLCEAGTANDSETRETRGKHLTARRAGEVAAYAGARQLYLTHLTGRDTDSEIKEAASGAYNGTAHTVCDRQVITLFEHHKK